MVITDLWKYFGDELIFREITAAIGPADRIGLVGANGVGKTTLLRVLVGEIGCDRGKISRGGGFTQSCLWQATPQTERTMQEFLEEPFAEQIASEKRLRALEQELAALQAGPSQEQALQRYGRLHDRFEHRGGYDYLVQINWVRTGLGFSELDLTRPLNTFSGGEQMRLSLARLLLSAPSLLVLDEPTNHLDLEAISWLEDFLSGYRGAFIVVSHDRYFLDKLVDRIWELEGETLHQYRGGYSAYLPQRDLRREQLGESIKKQRLERERLEFFVRKFKAGTRARQAKSVEKRLARLPNLEQVLDDPNLAFRFQPRRRSGERVAVLENVGVSYGTHQVLQGVNIEVSRGERIALLGPNGSGKSTLLKTLQGEVDFEGKLHWGSAVDQGYFSQQIVFDPENTVLEELYEEHRLDLGTLRSVLGRFLFSGEDVFKQTSVLSGGERNRLALTKLLLHRPNLLLLDEPTNHLDIYAREALENALSEFDGTIIFVSHDRYFIEKLATRVWALADGALLEYAGGYRAYEDAVRLKTISERSSGRERAVEEPAKRASTQLGRQRTALEEQIIALEERLAKLEQQLAEPQLYQNEADSLPVILEHQELNERLSEKYKAWENLADSAEEGAGGAAGK